MQNELKAAWFKAAIKGDLEKMISLLEQGADLDWQGEFTNLNKKEVDYLDFAEVSKDNASALKVAIALGHYSVVHFLLNKGAHTGWHSPNAPHVMRIAIKSGLPDMIRLLLEHGIGPEDQNESYLHTVIFQHSVIKLLDLKGQNPFIEILDILLEAGADINYFSWLQCFAHYLGGPPVVTPLGQAFYRQDYEMARHLLERGADINAFWENIRSLTTLSCVTGGYGDATEKDVQLVLDWGGRVDIRDKHMMSVIEYPYTENSEEEWQRVRAAKMARIRASVENESSLLAAVIWGETERVQRCLQQGGEVDYRAYNGATPLFWAAARDQVEIIRLLLEAGADLEARDGEGHTPLMLAVYHERHKAIRLLLDAGADVNTKNSLDETSLSMVRRLSNSLLNADKVIAILVEAGATE
jgi:ankyrin repeat protein